MVRQKEKTRYQSCISVRAGKLVTYTKVYKAVDPNERFLDLGGKKKSAVSDRTGKTQAGTISYKSAQRLRDALNLLVGTAVSKRLYIHDLGVWINFKLNFITLTLPSTQVHTDKEIHSKVFAEFIKKWKYSNSKLLYVYKAETQDNGNLHYHLTTNSFIHHKRLRKWWNKSCNALGYMDRCSVKDANSTDVHAIKNVKDIAAYLSSYVAKKDVIKSSLKGWIKDKKRPLLFVKNKENWCVLKHVSMCKRQVQIKAWDASNALLAKPLTLVADAHYSAFLEALAKCKRHVKHDYVTITYTNVFGLDKENSIKVVYKDYIKNLIAQNAAVNHLLN